MARDFFNNLPNTTTPLTAPRLNALLDGDEPMGNIKVDSIQTKNMIGGWFDGGIDDTTGADTATHDLRTDYIPVDFTTNSNYRISGLPSATYRNFVCAYNSSKQFLGRTSASIIATRGLNSGSFTAGTPQGTGSIAYLRVRVYSTPPASAVADVQMEVGASTTTFAQSKYLGYISGSNANGSYIKYDDGTLICWNRIQVASVPITNAMSGLYVSGNLTNFGSFPMSFLETVGPVVTITSESDDNGRYCWVFKSQRPSNTEIRGFRVVSYTSTTLSNANFTYTAIGRWK